MTVICCLAGSAAPAYAAGTGSEDAAVTFTNEPKNSPDLYVSKIVENADPERRYDQFQFVLKRGGAVAANRVYRLYELGDGGSREILKKDALGNVIPFTTDSTGAFTLEAGQRACFENLGPGVKYEVIEQDVYLKPRTEADGSYQTAGGNYTLYYRCKRDDEGKVNKDGEVLHKVFAYQPRALERDGYSKVEPAGGTTGECTMPVNGDMVTFTNRFTPGDGGKTADLVISKTIVTPTKPEKWAVPVTEDFWFRVEIDKGEGLVPYADEAYTATNTVTGKTETGRTASDGTFSLKGGWTAVFKEVPAGVDYRVYELLDAERADPAETSGKTDVGLPEGWWSAQKVVETEDGQKVAVRQGSTLSPETLVNFTNSNLSFVVTKRLEDNSKPQDVDFNFRLADANRNGMFGIKYYLYQTTGTPVYFKTGEDAGENPEDSEQGPPVNQEGEERYLTLCRTGKDGAFTLKAGQAAVFIGLKPGTNYMVTETGTDSYIQMLPLPEDSDEIHTVTDTGNVQMLEFTNKKVDQTGRLTVLKQVVNETGEGSLQSDAQFRFILYRRLKTAADLQKALGSSSPFDSQPAADAAVKKGLEEGTLLQTAGKTVSAGAWDSDYHYDSMEIYAPVEGTLFTRPDGLSNPNDQTGPDQKRGLAAGEFTLQAGKTAVFERLTVGEQYLVREVKPGSEYTENTEGSAYCKITVQEEGKSVTADAQTAELAGDGLNFTFVNRFTPEKVDLTIIKTDAEKQVLPGAEFMLYLKKGRDPENKVLPVPLPEGVTAESFCYRTDDDGKVMIPDLKLGTYWLYETKAPHSFALLKEPIEIQILRTEDGTLQTIIDGRIYPNASEAGYSENDIVRDVTVSDKKADSSDEGTDSPTEGNVGFSEKAANAKAQIGIRVLNLESYKLPSTGGMGIYGYLISGILLMMGAALILYKYQRRGRC